MRELGLKIRISRVFRPATAPANSTKQPAPHCDSPFDFVGTAEVLNNGLS
jgi:hypothetical protein